MKRWRQPLPQKLRNNAVGRRKLGTCNITQIAQNVPACINTVAVFSWASSAGRYGESAEPGLSHQKQLILKVPKKPLPHHGPVVGMHWWDRLQPVNARWRAHFFSPSHGRGSGMHAGCHAVGQTIALCGLSAAPKDKNADRRQMAIACPTSAAMPSPAGDAAGGSDTVQDVRLQISW